MSHAVGPVPCRLPLFWTQGACQLGLSVWDKNSFIVNTVLQINIPSRKDSGGKEISTACGQICLFNKCLVSTLYLEILVVMEMRRTLWASRSWLCARDGLEWETQDVLSLYLSPLLVSQQQQQQFFSHCLPAFLLLRPHGRMWVLLHIVSVSAICPEMAPFSGF